MWSDSSTGKTKNVSLQGSHVLYTIFLCAVREASSRAVDTCFSFIHGSGKLLSLKDNSSLLCI